MVNPVTGDEIVMPAPPSVIPATVVVGYAPIRSSLNVPKGGTTLTAPVAKLTNVLPVFVIPPAPRSANGAAAPSAIVDGPPWLHASAGIGLGVAVGAGVGVAGGGMNPGGVGVAPGASVGLWNEGTLQLGHPPLHDARRMIAATGAINRTGKNARYLRMKEVLSSTLELYAEAEVRPVVRLADGCMLLCGVFVAAIATVEKDGELSEN